MWATFSIFRKDKVLILIFCVNKTILRICTRTILYLCSLHYHKFACNIFRSYYVHIFRECEFRLIVHDPSNNKVLYLCSFSSVTTCYVELLQSKMKLGSMCKFVELQTTPTLNSWPLPQVGLCTCVLLPLIDVFFNSMGLSNLWPGLFICLWSNAIASIDVHEQMNIAMSTTLTMTKLIVYGWRMVHLSISAAQPFLACPLVQWSILSLVFAMHYLMLFICRIYWLMNNFPWTLYSLQVTMNINSHVLYLQRASVRKCWRGRGGHLDS